MTVLKKCLYLLRSVIIEFATFYISLPLPVRTGRSRSARTVRIECSPQVSQGDAFLSDRLGGVRGLSGVVFARGDSLVDPVSLSLSQHLDFLSSDSAERCEA